MLELADVSVGYGVIDVVHKVSLHVEQTGAVAILGRNGAGKTSTLRAVSGELSPRNGAVFFNGKNLRGMSPSERVAHGLALVPEGRRIFSHLTVMENLQVGAYCRSLKRPALQAAIGRVFDIFPQLGELRRRRAGQLSGGEQQMLAVGRAIMSSPKLMLLDEPSLGLAPVAVKSLYGSLRRLREDEKLGLVIVEQYVDLALSVCDSAYVLDKGHVSMHGTADQVMEAVRQDAKSYSLMEPTDPQDLSASKNSEQWSDL